MLVAASSKEPSPDMALFATVHIIDTTSPVDLMPLERSAYSPYALEKSINLSSFSLLPSVKPPFAKYWTFCTPAARVASSPDTPNIRPARTQFSTLLSWTLGLKEMTASVPASPAILTPRVKPPLAKAGIATSDRLKPNVLPAKFFATGTFSSHWGTVNEKLFRARMIPLTTVIVTDTMPFISPTID